MATFFRHPFTDFSFHLSNNKNKSGCWVWKTRLPFPDRVSEYSYTNHTLFHHHPPRGCPGVARPVWLCHFHVASMPCAAARGGRSAGANHGVLASPGESESRGVWQFLMMASYSRGASLRLSLATSQPCHWWTPGPCLMRFAERVALTSVDKDVGRRVCEGGGPSARYKVYRE